MAALVLDIAGHGASAALTALRCREIVRAALQSESDPGSALRILDQLTDDIEDDLFVTGFIAVIDHATGGVSWANAGHPPALLRHGPELIELPPTGPIVGPYSGAWSTERATIHPGGRLVMYTDGIPEARGSSGFFGSERLATLVVSGPAKAQELVTELLAEARSHAEGRLADDATAVVIARDEPESSEALPDVPATVVLRRKGGGGPRSHPLLILLAERQSQSSFSFTLSAASSILSFTVPTTLSTLPSRWRSLSSVRSPTASLARPFSSSLFALMRPPEWLVPVEVPGRRKRPNDPFV